ncbi:MAG: PAS domain S-box protein [Chloroflexi bacterium]|nr:PAS domain S-box protein [Chloroflexota bacterium]
MADSNSQNNHTQTKTERQQSENTLRQERALLNSLLDSIPDLIFYKDVAGVYLGCNTSFAEFAGRPTADIVGKTDFDMFPHEVAAFFREQDTQMMAQGQARQNEEWVNYPDGRRVLLDTLKTPFYDADKKLLGLIGISRDATAAARAQEEVRRLGYVVEQSLDGTAVAGLDGIIQFVNPAWAAMHGYTTEELIGQHLSIFHTPAQVAQEVEPVNQQAIASGQPQRAEIGHVRKDGSTFPTLMTIGLLKDGSGNPVGLVASAQDITEQKIAGQALRESENRYKQILDAITQMVLVKGPKSSIVWANKAFRDYYGMSSEEVQGLIDAPFNEPDYTQQYIRDDAYVFETGEILEIPEEFVTRHDGYVGVFHTVKSPILGESGAIIMTVGVSEEITARKAAEKELLENQLRLMQANQVVENSPAILFRWRADEQWTVEYVSENVARFGYTPEDLLSGRVSYPTLIHPEDLARVAQEMRDYSASGVDRFAQEYRIVTRDGQVRWTDSRTVIIHDDAGQITHYQGIVIDITERQETESELQLRNSALEAAADSIVITDPRGTILYVNSAFTRLTHYEREEAVGNSLRLIKSGVHDEAFYRQMWGTLLKGEAWQGEIINRRKDGVLYPEDMSITPVKSAAGEITHFVAIKRDISERKETEKTLRENETRLLEATRAARLYYWELDIDTQQFTFTPEYYKLLGTTAEEEGGYTMLAADYARKYVPETESAIVQKETIAALETTDPNFSREFDSLNMTKDGRVIPIRVRFRVVKDNEGRTIKTIGANQDITEQVKAEQALRDAQIRSETILRSVSVPMLISKIQSGQIAYANENLAQIVRQPLDTLVGNATPNFYVRSEDRTAVISQIQSQGSVQNYQLQLRRSDGELFSALLSARLIEFEGEPAIITSLIDITDRVVAEEKLARQAADLQTVADVSTAVRANLQNQQELLQQVVNLTKERFGLYHAHIYLLDAPGKGLALTAGAGEVGQTMTAEGRRISLDQEQSIVARAARTRQGVIINDVQTDPGFLSHPLLPHTRAEMAVPMLIGDQVIGVLDIQSDQPDYFTAEDANIQTTLAAQIAIALENARLLAESQQAVTELDALTRRLTRESWESYLQNFDEQEKGYVYDYGQLRPLDDAGDGGLAPTAGQPSGNGYLAQALTVHGEPIGHLAFYQEEDETTQSDLDTAEIEAIVAAVAEQLSARIENIRLTDETQAALLLTENLYEAGRRLNTAGENLQEAVAAVAEAAPIPAVTRLILFLTEFDTGGNPAAIRHVANWYSGKGNRPPTAGARYTRDVLQNMDAFNTREIITVNDVAQDERLSPLMRFMFQQMGTPSLAILPLWVGNQQLGSLFLETTEPYLFRGVDLEPYQALSGQLAIAIDRQRLLTEAEQRAERERQIRTITDKIRRGVDRETILRLAREEIGQMLGATTAVGQLGTSAQLLQRLHGQVAAETEVVIGTVES